MQPAAEAPVRDELYKEFGGAAPEVILSHLYLKRLSEPSDLATFSIRTGIKIVDKMRNRPMAGYEIYLGDRVDFLTEQKLLACLQRGTVDVWVQGSLNRLRSKMYDRTREMSFSFFQLQEEVGIVLQKLVEEGCPGEASEILGEALLTLQKLFPPKKEGDPPLKFEDTTAGQLRLFNRELVKALVKRLKEPRGEETSRSCQPKQPKR